jgi:MFS-type transporter involved in bile tolerance (Atg22 family)
MPSRRRRTNIRRNRTDCRNDNNNRTLGNFTCSAALKVLLLFATSILVSSNHHHQYEATNKGVVSNTVSNTNLPWGITRTTATTTIVSRGGAIPNATRRGEVQKIKEKKPDVAVTTMPNHKKNQSNNNKSLQKNNGSGTSLDDDPRLLILIRILFFTYYASLGSLLPYLPVYYHSLGHGGQIIGMLGAIKPFTTFLVAPLWGIISDQSGSPFRVLYFTFLISLVGQLLVAWRHDPSWIMSMVFITALFNAPVKSLLDSMVMANIKNSKLYGRLRLWGQLGFGVGSSVVGIILSKSQQAQQQQQASSLGDATATAAAAIASTTATATIISGTGTTMEKIDQIWQKITGYKLLFFTHALLSIPTFICMRAFDRWTKKDETTTARHQNPLTTTKTKSRSSTANDNKPNVWDGIRVLFHNSDALLFFFLVLVVGISSGVIENFAYVRIREVGGGGREMGLSRLVSSMAGAPMFWFSGPLTELLGADRVLALSLVNYVVRYFNYAFMETPLQGLPAEALRGATFAAFWSTCTIYASRIAPPGMQATMVRDKTKNELHN